MISDNLSTKQTESPTGRESLDGNHATESIDDKENKYYPGDLDYSHIDRRRRYTRSRFYVLAREYVKIRNDLLIAVSSDWAATDWRHDYAAACRDYLARALKGLQSRRLRIYYCASMLDLAAGSLVWLYSEETVKLRFTNVKTRLEELRNVDESSGYGST